MKYGNCDGVSYLLVYNSQRTMGVYDIIIIIIVINNNNNISEVLLGAIMHRPDATEILLFICLKALTV